MSPFSARPSTNVIPVAKNEGASNTKRKGVCLQCGIKTYTNSLFGRKALSNENVHRGVCIKCRPTSVPSEVLQDWKKREAALVACSQDGISLATAAPELQNDKVVVLAACSQNGFALNFASNKLINDKEVVLVACSQNGQALQFAPSLEYAFHRLQNDQEVVMAACSEDGSALQFAFQQLQNDQEVVMPACLKKKKKAAKAACSEDGLRLKLFSETMRNEKEVVLAACSQNGYALRFASHNLRNDKEVVLAACSRHGQALRYASGQMRNDKEVVMLSLSKNANAVKFVSKQLRDNKDVVLLALSKNPLALKLASRQLQNDKEAVLLACSQDGSALQFASDVLRADKEVVMAATASKPASLKFALGGLNQDKDCLISAGLWDSEYVDNPASSRKKKIVLSTRFSLAAKSSAHATRFTVELKRHPYIVRNKFGVYSPNAFNKNTCDPQWTNKDWPCRGTYSSCQFPPKKKTGAPQADCCWRYSFRCHLRETLQCSGFMLQVVDRDQFTSENALGHGQEIEEEMARDLGVKILKFFEPLPGQSQDRYAKAVDRLVSNIQKWYKEKGS